MESMDEQESAPLQSSSSSSSNYNYFTHKALQAGYLKPEDLDSGSRRDVRVAILKELEKERIRQEIIAAEIAKLSRGIGNPAISEPRSRFAAAAEEEAERIEEMSVEERLRRLAAMRHGLPPLL